MLFWNGPEGLSFDRISRLPGLGPHLTSPRDFGNAYTREPLERYTSPACDMEGRKPIRLSWKAEVPEKTQIKFQLRWAESAEGLDRADWAGPAGEGSFYEDSGAPIEGVELEARWLQYRAALVHFNGCRSPRLEEVRVDFV